MGEHFFDEDEEDMDSDGSEGLAVGDGAPKLVLGERGRRVGWNIYFWRSRHKTTFW